MSGGQDLTAAQRAVTAPLLPDKSRGVARVDDRRVISGILHIPRTGAPRRDLPEPDGPRTTVCTRYRRWAKRGARLRIFEALAERPPGSLHPIDSSIVRARQHAAGGRRGARITPSVSPVED